MKSDAFQLGDIYFDFIGPYEPQKQTKSLIPKEKQMYVSPKNLTALMISISTFMPVIKNGMK